MWGKTLHGGEKQVNTLGKYWSVGVVSGASVPLGAPSSPTRFRRSGGVPSEGFFRELAARAQSPARAASRLVLGLLKFWDAKNMLFACFHVIFARYSTTLVVDFSGKLLSIYELPQF